MSSVPWRRSRNQVRPTPSAKSLRYWLTATAGSSANLYYEGARALGAAQEPSSAPTGVAVFPGDFAARRVAERANNIVHWSEFDRGSHFAAIEAPDLPNADVREFFRRLR
jgi:epoxide hydrolase